MGIPKDEFVQSILSECAAHASDMKYGPFLATDLEYTKKDKALFAISYAPNQSPRKRYGQATAINLIHLLVAATARPIWVIGI